MYKYLDIYHSFFIFFDKYLRTRTCLISGSCCRCKSYNCPIMTLIEQFIPCNCQLKAAKLSGLFKCECQYKGLTMFITLITLIRSASQKLFYGFIRASVFFLSQGQPLKIILLFYMGSFFF